MEPIYFNSRPYFATIHDTADGFRIIVQATFTVPAGYQFTLRRGLREWTVEAVSCLACPAGELVTWLTVRTIAWPVNVVPSKSQGHRHKGWH